MLQILHTKGVRVGFARFFLHSMVRVVVVMGVILTSTFFVMRSLPGNPARAVAGVSASAKTVAQIKARLGLDNSLPHQFLAYCQGLMHGNLGQSFLTGESVRTVISERVGPTFQLALSALVLLLIIAVLLGTLGAVLSHGGSRKYELIFSGATGVLSSLPEYLAGTLLAFFFAVLWRILPISGAASWKALILPAVAMAVRPGVQLARILRVRTLEVLDSSYIRTARSKRLSVRTLYFRHVIPNSITTVVALAGVIASGLIGGAVIIEGVFARPGLGTTLVTSVISADYAVVEGIVLLLAFAVVIVNLLADLLLGLVDPRTRAKL